MTTLNPDRTPDGGQAEPNVATAAPTPVPFAPTITPDAAPDPRGLGGLLALIDGAERPLPLRRVRVRATIAGDVCRTTIHQVFANPFEAESGTLLEAVHIFPLPAEGAVTEMSLVAGDLRVRAECRERAAAEKAFAEAREKGHRAGLLTAERADVHTLRVTNLPPGEEIRVEIVLLERLETQDGERRWRFPTVIAPRYLPGEAVGHDGPGILPDTNRAPDASRLQPPLRLAGGTPLDLEVEVVGPVGSVSSSLHAVRLDLAAGGVRVAPSSEATLDRDFVLAIGMGRGGDSTSVPQSHAWSDGSHTLLYIEPPTDIDAPTLPRDAVFVLDRSGSMSGRKMEAARLALRTALRGLLPGDRFHLLAFDNRVEAFSDGLVPYGEDSLAAAEEWLAGINPRGGTEMREALRAAMAGDTPAGRLRTILLITDGQVWNQAELLRSIAARSADTLVFTMGIDTAVNDDLLRRMARLGGGTCELLTPREDIEAAVTRLEIRFGSPVATGVRVNVEDHAQEDGARAGEGTGNGTRDAMRPARPGERSLFAGMPASLLLEGSPRDQVLRVHMDTSEGARSITVPVRPLDSPLGPLWARERVSALEDRWAVQPDERKPIETEIRDVALAHGIASRFTAFVAVIETTSAEGERVEIVQPVELPAEWDESFRGAAAQAPSVGAARMSRGPIGGVSRLMMGERSLDMDAEDVGGALHAGFSETVHRWAAKAPEARAGGRSRRGSRAGQRPDERQAATDAAASAPAKGQPKDSTPDPAGELAREQRADGSFDGDVERTAAALLRLIELGHTRRKGLRRRVVAKAARWLREHGGEAEAAREALAALARAEREGGGGTEGARPV